jgi:hypothetical protein
MIAREAKRRAGEREKPGRRFKKVRINWYLLSTIQVLISCAAELPAFGGVAFWFSR